MYQIIHWFKKPITDSTKLYWELLKVMVPIMIIIRVGMEFGLIKYASYIFTPFMDMVGLPAEAGLIWTTAILVNIYAAMVALVALLPQTPMTIAQVTVLGSMLLIAHSLPIEQRIVQKSGPSLLATAALRIIGALLYGAILNLIYSGFQFFQTQAHIDWLPQTSGDANFMTWAYDSVISLFSIFWVIFALVLLLKVLDLLKITNLISRLLSPILGLMGISKNAIPVTMIGVMLGLSYGGALIMREAKEGNMEARDIFLSLSFLCLFHSVIEDTLLIFALGADLSGILLGRFIFAFCILFLIGYFIKRIPTPYFNRLLFRQT